MLIQELDRFKLTEYEDYYVFNNLKLKKGFFNSQQGTELAVYDNFAMGSVPANYGVFSLVTIRGMECKDSSIYEWVKSYARPIYLRIE